MNSWYKIETPEGHYYTPFPDKEMNYEPIPTHADHTIDYEKLAQVLNENPELEIQSNMVLGQENTQRNDPIELPAGCYSYLKGGFGEKPKLMPFELREEKYVDVKNNVEDIRSDLKSFFNSEEYYRSVGAPYKRGYLWYGPPGNGKSAALRQLLKTDMPEDAIIIFMDEVPGTKVLNIIRDSLKDRWTIFVMEEFVSFYASSKNAMAILDFLDGESTVDKSIYIATTNYPESLPKNIVNRPSRFDKLVKVGNPDANDRAKILSHYLQREATQEEIDATKNFSIAQIKEVVTQSVIRDVSFNESLKFVNKHKKLADSDFSQQNSIGIKPGLGISDEEDLSI